LEYCFLHILAGHESNITKWLKLVYSLFPEGDKKRLQQSTTTIKQMPYSDLGNVLSLEKRNISCINERMSKQE